MSLRRKWRKNSWVYGAVSGRWSPKSRNSQHANETIRRTQTVLSRAVANSRDNRTEQNRTEQNRTEQNRTDCTPVSVLQNICSLNVLFTNLKSPKWKRESHSTLRSWSQAAEPPSHGAANWGGRHVEADQTRPVQTNHSRHTGLHSTAAQLVAKTWLVPHFCNTDVFTSVLLRTVWTGTALRCKWCTYKTYPPGVHKRRANKFFTLPPKMFGPLVWKLRSLTLARVVSKHFCSLHTALLFISALSLT